MDFWEANNFGYFIKPFNHTLHCGDARVWLFICRGER